MSPYIRRLSADDGAAFRAIRLQGLRENPEAFGSSYEEEAILPLSFFQQRAAGNDNSHLYGAWHGEQLLGVAALVREQQIKTRHKANIYSVFVAPEARGQGVGHALISTLLEHAHGLPGVTHLYLAATRQNLAAVRLYEGLGFETYGIEPAALCINDRHYDEVLMVKLLS